MKEPLEKHTQAVIMEYLKLKGIFAWVNKTQGTYSVKRGAYLKTNMMKGVPDILAIMPDGKFLGIEVKRRPNKPTPEQIAFLAAANDRGAYACLAYSLDDVRQYLGFI